MGPTRLPYALVTWLFLGALGAADAGPGDAPAGGVLPTDAAGRPLNFDFETGDLRDWRAEGPAFARPPVEGDAVNRRRGDMHSNHAGRFWVGGCEGHGDGPHGTLVSAPFVVTRPFARFLLGGGSLEGTRVEVVRQDTGEVVYKTFGESREDMVPVAVDLTAQLGKMVFLRLVDDESVGWGHVNFDDFKLWASRPPEPLRPTAPPRETFAHDGLAPAEAAAAMTVPPGFEVTLFAGEPDVVQPIACATDHRGRLWVAEAYSYPVRVPEDKARDRILILEDRDGDGRFDSRKVFAEKLNLVSGLELGFGGVFVGAAPNFLFIPDADGDDRPDGPPQVLLDGWGYQDSHETLNSFQWGPDGWLYGCQGVFTHSRVGRPGTPDADRTPINAGLWRYHPTRRAFEVFAHGTSNPWGVDFDDRGRCVITACVIPHLYYMIPGGRYERQAGPHFNPYTYDDIKTIADHRHYVGGNPHAGNGRSESAGGGHAHAGALIYQGDAWPAEYRGSLFMNNIHGARLNRDTLEPRGSGLVGRHAPDFLLANDRWSQVVSLRPGADGQVFMVDWYDKNQCHHKEVDAHDRTNGRIFQVRHGARRGPVIGVDPGATPAALVTLLASTDEWHARHARMLLQERGPGLSAADREATQTALRVMAFGDRPTRVRLNALWALHALNALDGATASRALDDADPFLRAWGVRLAAEGGKPAAPLLARFAAMARSDDSPVVRLDLASALQRMPLADRWPILEGLLAHAEDAGDHNIPLMVWYAAEPLAAADPARALRLAFGVRLPDFLPFTARRVVAIGTPESLATLVEALGRAGDDGRRLAVVRGLNESLKGRRRVAMPASWPGVYRALKASPDAALRSQATALALGFGDPSALEDLRAVLSDRSHAKADRLDALEALLKAHDPELPAPLRRLLDDPAVRGPALRGLAGYDDKDSPAAVLAAYPSLPPADRRDALNTLASRTDSARALLDALAAGRVAAADLSADLVRQLRNLKDSGVDAALARSWGTVRDSPADKLALLDRYRAVLTARTGQTPDPSTGRDVFTRTCAQCHTLFGAGGKIGPELTGSNRADREYVLSNVVDPGALIGKDYVAHIVATTDGRILTGMIRGDDKDALSLQTANELVVIPQAEVEQRRPSEQSMMPEDLWKPLSDHEIRSLAAYLAAPAQVPLPPGAAAKAGPTSP